MLESSNGRLREDKSRRKPNEPPRTKKKVARVGRLKRSIAKEEEAEEEEEEAS